jgi:hypothetical protein
VKFLTWFKSPPSSVGKLTIIDTTPKKLEPFFFFPHGAQHKQLDRALKRCSVQVDDVVVRRLARVLTHGPNLIGTVMIKGKNADRIVFANSMD